MQPAQSGKTCYLHIGSPKTGSTSVQTWCFKNKDVLEQQGLLYPGTWNRHNAILAAFHPDPGTLRFSNVQTELSSTDGAKKVLESEFTEISASAADTVVFSNENFLNASDKLDLVGLRDALRQHFATIRILCYVRDPFKMLISRSQEQVKSGVSTFQAVCARPPVLQMRKLTVYLDVFGRDAINLQNFDEVIKTQALSDHFVQTMKPGLDIASAEDTAAQNASLSLEAALIMSGLNESHGYKRNWQDRKLQVAHLRGIGSTPFGLPPDAILSVKDKLLEQYDLLAAAGMEFTPPDWDALPQVKPNWSSQTLEQVALAMNALAQKANRKGNRRNQGKRRNAGPKASPSAAT